MSFWAGLYTVREYPSQRLISSSRRAARHAIYRARLKGYSVRLVCGMYELPRILPGFPCAEALKVPASRRRNGRRESRGKGP